jgi:phosphodiesterase/alkaline phosphatase D-like protein
MLSSSATSFGLAEETGIPVETLQAVAQSSDPHYKFTDLTHRGYGVVQITKNEVRGEFKAVSDAKDPHGTVSSLAKFVVESGKPELHKV